MTDSKIRLMKSTFYHEQEVKEKLCKFIMEKEQLSMSHKCAEFENEFSKFQNQEYSVLFNSGSSANLALIQSLLNLNILRKEDKVGFSALTWATNVMPLLQLGLNPVPVDVSLETLNVSSETLLRTLENTDMKVLFITNLLGFSGDLDKIKAVCEQKGIVLIEDNCESFGSELNNTKLGSFGLAGTFSTFVGHHLSTIEGGMVCTNDKELHDMLLMVRAHGWDRNLDQETQTKLRAENNIDGFYSRYAFFFPAYNLRPTEITGFIGVEQLKYAEEINLARENNFKEFSITAGTNSDFEKLNVGHMSLVSNFAFPLICKDLETFNSYRNKFEENNVEIRPIVGGSIVEQPFFRNYLSEKGLSFSCPNARKIHQFGFYFPNNPELTLEETERIKSLLSK
ncbi:DegT/DnrJ/EryC1/StrS aminotransferase family protein [Candidatus Woesearchaeota archaeon]|jgi:CDP-4-dehydro-6-deoxyglucose reductase, E1|nr:DegT/DnrJ/EryC1/StrS aminotransferase family protein [Candidatus Woesearchaeota archaeon]MBT4110608.1 DegT/DnrJ/EryC1/StrS aminotransferase family protein [Candidatus Woesearchaeota archaeon]MBT4335868.1 DegT/DnrJ/EryC1/StrS aminotransferase family protein [Candidatus Woesearchaeota archaeon]MBT4469153.1 DegT/DnrJ/EryC1/StrS aminotransferase family protein [Candidatus Woesearchaeota archaeon]MBT6744528.1 DegT/DnrJ/EryC1/StrS aminotransferase family protein [Candidatus Woesearchaeota archaeon